MSQDIKNMEAEDLDYEIEEALEAEVPDEKWIAKLRKARRDIRYDHGFTLGFSVISNTSDGSDVTHEMFLKAIRKRLRDLEKTYAEGGENLIDACDVPFDSFKVDN